jgi:hypothetical protein
MIKTAVSLSAALCALILVILGSAAMAAASPTATGGGSRLGNEWEIAGVVREVSVGEGTGHFTIVHHVNPVFTPTVCTYDTFEGVSIVGNIASFDAEGVCRGESEFGEFEFAAANHFTIVDNGEPGTGADTVDVNFLGPSGIAVPGGVIDSGNFQVSG